MEDVYRKPVVAASITEAVSHVLADEAETDADMDLPLLAVAADVATIVAAGVEVYTVVTRIETTT